MPGLTGTEAEAHFAMKGLFLLLEAIFVILAVLALDQFAAMLLGVSVASHIKPTDLLAIKLLQVPLALLVIRGFLRFHGQSLRSIGLRRPAQGWINAITTGAAATFVLLLLSSAVAFLARAIFKFESLEPFQLEGEWALPAFYMVGILAGGVAEEVQFRGYLYLRLEEFFKPFGAAQAGYRSALFVSLVFASLHLYEGPATVAAIFAVSLGLQYLYLRSGRNLLPCMVCHSLFNCVQITLLFWTSN
ncbi:MAG: CPBP family intramembrane metalloprotease [Planctomycetes bacterium]|nr:CPBP family intramembrane metalloprotease [Planctomycetota bacterium]